MLWPLRLALSAMIDIGVDGYEVVKTACIVRRTSKLLERQALQRTRTLSHLYLTVIILTVQMVVQNHPRNHHHAKNKITALLPIYSQAPPVLESMASIPVRRRQSPSPFSPARFPSNDHPKPPQAPLIRRARWMSFCMMVTRLAWIAQRFASSNKWTRKASALS